MLYRTLRIYMSVANSSKEVIFGDDEILLSTTKTNSEIKYANPEFCRVAGFTFEELTGNPHNIVRHPDMPKDAFKNLWQFIQQGQSWMGPVKNRCKNGDYYWVNAYVTPIKDDKGETAEYQSVRTKLDRDVLKRAESVYDKLNKGQIPFALKHKTDMTLWFQTIFILLSIALAALTITSKIPILVAAPLFLTTSLSSVLFFYWRKQYSQLLQDAKSVFDNDLMSYIYGGSNDAVSNINLALKMRKAEIKAITGRVSDISLLVTDGAINTATATEKVANLLNEQQSETGQVATAIHQMAVTVNDLAKTITQAAQAAEQGKAISENGQKVVNSTVEAIQDLSKQLSEVDSVITNLVEGTNSIGAVLGEISSIADQTNLLALNAAIEAARAGEQGRGFAVVADEVRALAQRTQQSTEEINKELFQLRVNSDSAVAAMKKGRALSDNCVELSLKTGTSLSEILTEVTNISDFNAQISTAIEEQSVVTEQVNQNVARINELSSVCNNLGKEATHLTSELLNQLNEQQGLINQFKD